MLKSVSPHAKRKMINHAGGQILGFPGRQAKQGKPGGEAHKLCSGLKRKRYNVHGKVLCISFMPLHLYAFLRLWFENKKCSLVEQFSL